MLRKDPGLPLHPRSWERLWLWSKGCEFFEIRMFLYSRPFSRSFSVVTASSPRSFRTLMQFCFSTQIWVLSTRNGGSKSTCFKTLMSSFTIDSTIGRLWPGRIWWWTRRMQSSFWKVTRTCFRRAHFQISNHSRLCKLWKHSPRQLSWNW